MTKFKISLCKITLHYNVCFVAQNFVSQSGFARRCVFRRAKFRHAKSFFYLWEILLYIKPSQFTFIWHYCFMHVITSSQLDTSTYFNMFVEGFKLNSKLLLAYFVLHSNLSPRKFDVCALSIYLFIYFITTKW